MMTDYAKRYKVTINVWADKRVILGPMLHDAERPCAAVTGTDLMPTRETVTLDAEGEIAARYVKDEAFCAKCFHPNRSEVQRLKTPEGV